MSQLQPAVNTTVFAKACPAGHVLTSRSRRAASRLTASRPAHDVSSSRSERSAGSVQVCCSVSSESRTDEVKSRKKAGRATYRPATYQEMVADAAAAVVAGLEDGLERMEVEFPSSSGDGRGYKDSSDDIIDANLQLAIVAARKIHEETGKNIHILAPDEGEYQRSYKMFKTALELYPGISLGHLGENSKGPFAAISAVFNGSWDGSLPDPSKAASEADVFMALNASTVELVEMEKYVSEVVQGRPIVAWNLELETLRADLGLLGFPSKELQYRFLSTFTSVFFIRQRDYSKSVAVAPFIINYSGALFREYPGPWQVMLRQDSGEYACIAERRARYNLGDVKQELLEAMGLDTEAEGSAMQFLRRGYKTSTWWEDATAEEKSSNWRQ